MGLSACLDRLATVCGDHDWAITGGLAVGIYTGMERTIGDVDVIMRTETLEEIASPLGLDVTWERTHDHGRIRTWEEGYAAGSVTGQPIEVMAGESWITVDGERYEIALTDTLFTLSHHRSIDGVTVPVVPPEEVLIQKTVLGREKDRDDIRALVSSREIEHDVLGRLLTDWGMTVETFTALFGDRVGKDLARDVLS